MIASRSGLPCSSSDHMLLLVQLRLRIIEAVRLHVLPSPVFKLKHAFPIFDTGLALHAAYYQPLSHGRLRNIGKSGATGSSAAVSAAWIPNGAALAVGDISKASRATSRASPAC